MQHAATDRDNEADVRVSRRHPGEVVTAANHLRHREIVQSPVFPIASALIRRANDSGRLRVPLELTDLPVLLWTGGALYAHLGVAASRAWRRYMTLMFDSFVADDDPVRVPIAHPAPTLAQIDDAVRSWHSS